MISKEVVDILLKLEEQEGAFVVRRGAQEYVMRRTYAGETKNKRKAISWAKKKDLYARQGGRCFGECGQRFEIRELEVDEFIPVSRGGERVRGNIRLLCSPCNKAKSNHTPGMEAKRTGKTVLAQIQKQRSIELDVEKLVPVVGSVVSK